MKEKQGRAFVVEGPESYALRRYPLPAVGQDDALLEVLVSGVDGSDIKYFKGQVAHRRNFPMIGGDEVVGRVVQIGVGASKRWQVSEGDMVVIEPHLGCGLCEECRRGFARFCVEHKGYGARFSCGNPPHFLGGFAEYMYLFPTTKLSCIGDLDPEVAVLIPSMLANGTQWACEVGQVQPGDAVVVLGCGQQGLGCTLAASEAGAEKIIVVGLDGDDLRFNAARRLGATHVVNATRVCVRDFVKDETQGKGVDVVIDVAGSASTPDVAVDLVRVRGRVVLAGLSGKDSTMALDRLAWREISILGSYSHSVDSFDRAVALAHRRTDDLSSVVSQRLPLDRTADSIALLESPINRPTKVVILPHMRDTAEEAANG